ncbi:MAG: peptidoglycan-associated lipoprotein Pal [Elusimicrobia bacterium]|nr:peptidoglycan-associated lipoprotein Pal [Elusimicrobiota bacterium]
MGHASRWSVVALCAALAVACAPKKTLKKGPGADSAGGTQSSRPDDVASLPPGVEVGEADIRDGGQFIETPDLQAIHFDYDAYALSEEARGTLRRNADYLRKHPDLDILVAGHCDERGTTEYNLALGQKRAKEVREYYIRIGVPGKTVATISYGEEKPACDQPSEACWRQNRRAESRIRARTASSSRDGFDPKAPQ